MRPRTVIITLLAAFLLAGYTALSPVKQGLIKGERLNIFLIGEDTSGNAPSLSFAAFISYEPLTGFLDIMALPAELMIPVPYEVTWRRVQRLDEIYSRLQAGAGGKRTAAIEELMEVVSGFMGNRFEFDYHILADKDKLQGLFDAMGGVPVEVYAEITFEDSLGSAVIPAGDRVLGGREVLGFLSSGSAAARRMNHHRFAGALLAAIRTPGTLPRIPGFFRAAGEALETDLEISDILVLLGELARLGRDNLRLQFLDGEFETRWSREYYAADRDNLRDSVDVVMNSQLFNLPPEPADRSAVASRRITAEVWNATGRSGLARDVTEYLRRRNVDVVRYGNFGARRRYTQVVSRTGDPVPAREVAEILGCRNIITDIDLSRMADINVVIGDDIEELWEN